MDRAPQRRRWKCRYRSAVYKTKLRKAQGTGAPLSPSRRLPHGAVRGPQPWTLDVGHAPPMFPPPSLPPPSPIPGIVSPSPPEPHADLPAPLRGGTAGGGAPGRADTEPFHRPPSPGGCLWDPASRADAGQAAALNTLLSRRPSCPDERRSGPRETRSQISALHPWNKRHLHPKALKTWGVLGGVRRGRMPWQSTGVEEETDELTQLSSQCRAIVSCTTKFLPSNAQHPFPAHYSTGTQADTGLRTTAHGA